MNIADLYIRVSTDEQADKGYSQRDQEERLRRYCLTNNIVVNKVIFEDHSAKSFNRPEWVKLLADLKKKGAKTTLILFTKWDRFSRNAGDAYQMISILTKLGVEPQAVEQPLDLSIPENKMMLAIYLAAPEVENDRRALNTFYGMRRARKEGRVMGIAPFGYINRSMENGKKYVAIKEPEASTMRLAFNEIAKGIFAPDQIRQQIAKSGKKILGRNGFHIAIRNPLYCGKIFIEKFRDEEAHFVKGQHEPLISEELFYRVQDILDGNKRNIKPNARIISDANLPLRGFLLCPQCGRNLTGSGSKGRNNIYYYYHCLSSCGFRFSAIEANELFEHELQKHELHPSMKDILRSTILKNYKRFSGKNFDRKKEIIEEIESLNNKMSIARDKLLSDKIDDEDYRLMKFECKERIEKLEEQLDRCGTSTESVSINSRLEKALSFIENISSLYRKGSIETKRSIIGSIFPEKLEFNGTTYRTARKNVFAEYIFQINNNLHEIKNRKNHKNYDFSCLVARRGVEPLLPE